MNTITIIEGTASFLNVYDIANEIDLAKLEQIFQERGKRLKFSKPTYLKSILFSDPPVLYALPSITCPYDGREFTAAVSVRFYDFGVASISFDFDASGTNLAFLRDMTKNEALNDMLEAKRIEMLESLIENLRDALKQPHLNRDFTNSYIICNIKKIDPPVYGLKLLDHAEFAPFILDERRSLSTVTREEMRKHIFSYYEDELVIVHFDAAFILDPELDGDIRDIIEFANAQLLELWYYDDLLDKELKKIYDRINQEGVISILRIQEYEKLALGINRTITELTEITERIDNSLKIIEDFYYADIYRHIMKLFRAQEWEESINKKLKLAQNVYQLLYNEIATKRAHLLEAGILLIILIEFIMILFKYK